jgi:hypothetical protein
VSSNKNDVWLCEQLNLQFYDISCIISHSICSIHLMEAKDLVTICMKCPLEQTAKLHLRSQCSLFTSGDSLYIITVRISPPTLFSLQWTWFGVCERCRCKLGFDQNRKKRVGIWRGQRARVKRNRFRNDTPIFSNGRLLRVYNWGYGRESTPQCTTTSIQTIVYPTGVIFLQVLLVVCPYNPDRIPKCQLWPSEAGVIGVNHHARPMHRTIGMHITRCQLSLVSHVVLIDRSDYTRIKLNFYKLG